MQMDNLHTDPDIQRVTGLIPPDECPQPGLLLQRSSWISTNIHQGTAWLIAIFVYGIKLMTGLQVRTIPVVKSYPGAGLVLQRGRDHIFAPQSVRENEAVAFTKTNSHQTFDIYVSIKAAGRDAQCQQLHLHYQLTFGDYKQIFKPIIRSVRPAGIPRQTRHQGGFHNAAPVAHTMLLPVFQADHYNFLQWQ